MQEKTNEEYRDELSKILEKVEDNDILRHFYVYVVNRVEEVNSDCLINDLIVELIGKVKSKRFSKRIYISITEFLKENPE